MPASHADSCGVAGVAGADGAGVAAFTANVVRFGTNGAAFLFDGGGAVPWRETWWFPPHKAR